MKDEYATVHMPPPLSSMFNDDQMKIIKPGIFLYAHFLMAEKCSSRIILKHSQKDAIIYAVAVLVGGQVKWLFTFKSI